LVSREDVVLSSDAFFIIFYSLNWPEFLVGSKAFASFAQWLIRYWTEQFFGVRTCEFARCKVTFATALINKQIWVHEWLKASIIKASIYVACHRQKASLHNVHSIPRCLKGTWCNVRWRWMWRG